MPPWRRSDEPLQFKHCHDLDDSVGYLLWDLCSTVGRVRRWWVNRRAAGQGKQSPVAQLVEQAAVNRLVASSSLAGGA